MAAVLRLVRGVRQNGRSLSLISGVEKAAVSSAGEAVACTSFCASPSLFLRGSGAGVTAFRFTHGQPASLRHLSNSSSSLIGRSIAVQGALQSSSSLVNLGEAFSVRFFAAGAAKRKTKTPTPKAKAAKAKAATVKTSKTAASAKKRSAASKRKTVKRASPAKKTAAKKAVKKKPVPRSPFAAVARAPSAYNLFVKENFAAAKAAHGDGVKSTTVLTALSKAFKELSADQKQKYVAQAEAGKAQAASQRAAVKAKIVASRANTPYIIYFKETYARVAAEHAGKKVSDIAKIMGKQWREMSAADKQKYVDMSAAERKSKGLPEPKSK